MRNNRTFLGLALSFLTTLAVGVGIQGTARASISDPSGFTHIWNAGTRQCIMAEGDTDRVAQWIA